MQPGQYEVSEWTSVGLVLARWHPRLRRDSPVRAAWRGRAAIFRWRGGRGSHSAAAPRAVTTAAMWPLLLALQLVTADTGTTTDPEAHRLHRAR